MGWAVVVARLDSFEIASQRSQTILAGNVFAVRHDKSEQIRICGTDIVDCMPHGREELVKPFVRADGAAKPATSGR